MCITTDIIDNTPTTMKLPPDTIPVSAVASLLLGGATEPKIRIQRSLVDVRSVHNSDTEMLVTLDVPGVQSSLDVRIEQTMPTQSRQQLYRGHRRLDSFADTGVSLVISLGDDHGEDEQRFPLATTLGEMELSRVTAYCHRSSQVLHVVIPKKPLTDVLMQALEVDTAQQPELSTSFAIPVVEAPCPTTPNRTFMR